MTTADGNARARLVVFVLVLFVGVVVWGRWDVLRDSVEHAVPREAKQRNADSRTNRFVWSQHSRKRGRSSG